MTPEIFFAGLMVMTVGYSFMLGALVTSAYLTKKHGLDDAQLGRASRFSGARN